MTQFPVARLSAFSALAVSRPDRGNFDDIGSGSADRLYGTDGTDYLKGLSGNDTMEAYAGDDELDGGPGDDVGTAGDGNDTAAMGDGNDTLWAGTGDAGNDVVEGGNGNDVLGGGGGDDTIRGDAGSDTIFGSTGNDILYGGNDTLGADESNVVWGGDGNDKLYAGSGGDTLASGAGNDTMIGGSGHDEMYGGPQNGGGITNDDYMEGRFGKDSLYGSVGNDTILGGAGDDLLYGGTGNDSIDGSTGNDVIYAGTGSDTIKGGDGEDVFILEASPGTDYILDFSVEQDTLHVKGVSSTVTTEAQLAAASSEGTYNGAAGLWIDFGGSNRTFLQGVSLDDLTYLQTDLKEPLPANTIYEKDYKSYDRDLPSTGPAQMTMSVGGAFIGTWKYQDQWGSEYSTDSDRIGIELKAGHSYSVQLEPYGGIPSLGQSIRFVGNAGTPNDGGIVTAFKDGLAYIDVAGSSIKDGTEYKLTVTEVNIPDAPANTSTTERLQSLGDRYEGIFQTANDEDWIGVKLEAGENYYVTVRSGVTGQELGVHGIYNGSGKAVSWTYGGPSGESAFFTAEKSGLYYFSPDNEGLFGKYYAFVTNVPADKVAGGTSTKATLTTDGTHVDGVINTAGDEDWYAVSLKAGHTYSINMYGKSDLLLLGTDNVPLGAGVAAELTGIYGTSGQRISAAEYNDPHSNKEAMLFTPTSSGTYYVAAAGTGNSTGNFRLRVTDLEDKEAGDNSTTAKTAVGDTYKGVNTGDDDWIAIELKAGVQYHFDANPNTLLYYHQAYEYGTLFTLELYGTNGSHKYIGVDEFDGTGRFSVSEDGLYYLDLRSYRDMTYDLIVTEVPAAAGMAARAAMPVPAIDLSGEAETAWLDSGFLH